MNKKPKGKKSFSSAELKKVRELIIQKCNSSSDNQKSIRKKLRDTYKFYISDFVDDITSVEQFDRLVAQDVILRNNTNAIYPTEEITDSVKGSTIKLDKGNRKEGLDPVVGDNSRVLILGTLPGDESIEKQEYYSKSGNRFWKIIYSLFGGTEPSTCYKDRVHFLKSHGIAIWDVLYQAVRAGSSDSDIEQEIPNDVKSFLSNYPTIELIAFNGEKSRESFCEI